MQRCSTMLLLCHTIRQLAAPLLLNLPETDGDDSGDASDDANVDDGSGDANVDHDSVDDPQTSFIQPHHIAP